MTRFIRIVLVSNGWLADQTGVVGRTLRAEVGGMKE
jgi:hypothetical protein